MKINLKCLFGMHNPIFKYRLEHPAEDIFQCERCGRFKAVNYYIGYEYWTKFKPVMKISIPDTGIGDLSDGYHTFNELYHHRAVLFSVICNANKGMSWKSKLHDDGTMYDKMFIVGINTPNGSATYHYNVDPYWDMYKVKELERAPKWDGHTAEDALLIIESLGN